MASRHEVESEDSDDMEWFDLWDKKMNGDRLGMRYSGAYYQFQTPQGVLSEGSDGPQIVSDTPCILTSCSKVFTGLAVMRTMHLKPQDWHPKKPMNEFVGWEEWKDFPVLDNVENTDGKLGYGGKVAKHVTIEQLLTHTNGWPFGLRATRARIRKIPLYFVPGTHFAYSIGHRILGWMLLDYWKAQPEGAGFEDLSDVFRFLVYGPLGLSEGTYLIKGHFEDPHSVMGEFFTMDNFDLINDASDDDPGDLALASTGEDMMKVAMLALRRGQLPDGSWYISRQEWDDWGGQNKLPEGKLSSSLAHWRMEGYDAPFMWRTLISRDTNAGHFGWNYFGATYHDCPEDCEENAGPPVAVGWKGFTSCGLRADYEQNIAFVAMQECMPDPGNRNLAECFHEGKCGEYTLAFIGRKLAELDEDDIEELQLERKGCICNPFHSVNEELESPPCFTSCFQNLMRCVYKLGLPPVVNILDYHRGEELDIKEWKGPRVDV
mmetsp:Transcript_38198/g.107983  ORF Transcript_38198/g.107983 Transcript_38198/m.107983 type:complete len:490 (-) Transcript_38198:216-1685(-)